MKAKNINHKLYWFLIKTIRNRKIFRYIANVSAVSYYKLFRRNKYFILNNRKYKYFYHLYNQTIAGERVVEVAIAKKLIDKYTGRNILEVGNVLSHYFSASHDILDKYERGKNVINKDVINYSTDKKYDLIISVSTMEHVGHSYGEKKNLKKFSAGIKNLKKLLSKNGVLCITVPIFYNPYVTGLIKKRKMPFDEGYFMKRYSFWNEWKQVNHREAFKAAEYDGYFANSNVIYIGFYHNAR